jgi:hypothetical protein
VGIVKKKHRNLGKNFLKELLKDPPMNSQIERELDEIFKNLNLKIFLNNNTKEDEKNEEKGKGKGKDI